MSHIKLKTKYNTEGNYGIIEEHTVYADHNLCNDYVTFYDHTGNIIMTIPDTIDNNLLDAINKLYSPFKENSKEYIDGIEIMTHDDYNKFK